MKSKKILYFHHAIGLGGAPRSLGFLIAGLNRDEFDPILVMPKRVGNDAVKRIFNDSGAKVIEETDIRPFHGSTVAPSNGLKDRAYSILSYNKLVACSKRIVDQINPDLVHLNSTCIVGAAKGVHQFDPSIPVIAHVREPLLQNWWGRNLARMNRRHVDWFVAIDQFGLDSIGLQRPRGNVIYNFVDRERFKSDSDRARLKRLSLEWKEDQVFFLSLSRVSKSNGALELAKIIRESDAELHPAANFVVAGFDLPPKNYAAAAMRELKSTPRCHVMPFVNDVVQLIDAADAIIAPFTTPHSARSVFEGAAMGKPAVVTNLPNLTELIVEGQTGFAFNSNDRIQFIESINRLCEIECRNRMGRASLEFATKMFDAKTNTEKTMQIYRELTNNR